MSWTLTRAPTAPYTLQRAFGLKVWDRKTRRVTTYGNPLPKGLPNSIIRTVLVDSQNRLWVGTEEGLSRMNLVD